MSLQRVVTGASAEERKGAHPLGGQSLNLVCEERQIMRGRSFQRPATGRAVWCDRIALNYFEEEAGGALGE
jgi:hypothetical protein